MLSEKMTLDQVNKLLGFLSEYHWEHGEDAYYTFGSDIKHNFLVKNEIDLTEEEYDALSDLIMGNLRDGEVKQSDIDAYDDEPEPDNRTPDQIHEDRLNEFTEEEIVDASLAAFEIMIGEEYAGKYTFDAIYNNLIPDTFGYYEGPAGSEDPVQKKLEEYLQARIEAARNWKPEA